MGECFFRGNIQSVHFPNPVALLFFVVCLVVISFVLVYFEYSKASSSDSQSSVSVSFVSSVCGQISDFEWLNHQASP